MQLVGGDLLVGPTDLTRFLACRHLARLDVEVARGLRPPPPTAVELLESLPAGPLDPGERWVERLRAEGRRIVTADAGAHDLEAATVEAMAAGADVVRRAVLVDGAWCGRADLLLRRDDRPGIRPWSYDVADTTTARRAPGAAVLHLAACAERLTVLQGVAPDRLVVGPDGEPQLVARPACSSVARRVRAAFADFVADPPGTVAEPVRHCGQCRWRETCHGEWRSRDDLVLVGQLRREPADRLRALGIGTVEALAAADPRALAETLPGTAERVVHQARLQVAERRTGRPAHRLLPPVPAGGLALLPAPSPGDVFFDMEGDPFVGESGLEYLFGIVEKGRYTGYWAREPEAERAAFESLVDHLLQAWRDDPAMHVYHYAPYEPTRLVALAGRHDTRGDDVDLLLRSGRLVDLYAVVKQGVQVGKESYSLKKLEDHYWPAGRTGAPVADALGSVVAFEQWLLDGAAGDGLLEHIRSYNEDDCRSTQALRDWLETLRAEGGGDAVFPRPAPGDVAPPARPSAPPGHAADGAPADGAPPGPEVAAVRLLGALRHWHRREASAGPPPRFDPPAFDPPPVGPPPALGPRERSRPVDGEPFEARLVELAAWVDRHGVDAPAPAWRAGRDLLLRRPPGAGAGPAPGPVRRPGESAVDAALRLTGGPGPGAAPPGVLAVQTPPGTGGAHLVARVVAQALAAGRQVGICTPGPTGPAVPAAGVVDPARPVTGPPALFATEGLRDRLDLLVVTGADRLPLAEAVAVSGSARTLLLVGDPQRSTAPGRGHHPPGAGVSALGHLLAGCPTVPDDRGLLLEETDRHPRIAGPLSALAYDGRLRAPRRPDRRRIDSAGALSGSGLRWVPVPGVAGRPPEEEARAAIVARLVAAVLADGHRTDADGVRHRLLPTDVLVLASRPAQLPVLREALEPVTDGPQVRLGTSAGPAPVVVLSLASRPDPHRLTEVLGRAEVLVTVVGDPGLLLPEAATPAQLRRADALNRFVDLATVVDGPGLGELVGVGRGERHPSFPAGDRGIPLPSPHGQLQPPAPA